jgi:hypothetical protein
VNFLRDLKADFEDLSRSYFPDTNLTALDEASKQKIILEIEADFAAGFISGIISICVVASEEGAHEAHCPSIIKLILAFSVYWIVLSTVVGPIFLAGVFTILFQAILSCGVRMTLRYAIISLISFLS